MEYVTLLGVTIGLFIIYKLVDVVRHSQWVHKPADRRIFVTGCDSGFGYELVQRLDSLGCHVYAGCLTEEGETQLLEICSERVTTFLLDVRNHDSVCRAYETVKDAVDNRGQLWAVVNNAGVLGLLGRDEWLTKDNYRDMMETNLFGLIDVTVTFLPLIKQSRGRIVNMSSMAGRLSVPPFVPYCMSKYGVEAFSDGLRRSLHAYGCEVALIEPGFFKTNIISKEKIRRDMTAAWNQATTDIQEEFGEDFLEHALRDYDKYDTTILTNLKPVIDAYEHALFSKHPRSRYVAGFHACVIWWPISVLPEWLGDFILRCFNPDPAVPSVLKNRA